MIFYFIRRGAVIAPCWQEPAAHFLALGNFYPFLDLSRIKKYNSFRFPSSYILAVWRYFMYSQLTVAKLFDLSQTQAETLLNRFQYPWEALPHIKEFILALGPSLPKDEYEEIKENVWAAKSAVIFPTAYLNGPVIIGKNTEVRHGAFIRGSALVGDDASGVQNRVAANLHAIP